MDQTKEAGAATRRPVTIAHLAAGAEEGSIVTVYGPDHLDQLSAPQTASQIGEVKKLHVYYAGEKGILSRYGQHGALKYFAGSIGNRDVIVTTLDLIFNPELTARKYKLLDQEATLWQIMDDYGTAIAPAPMACSRLRPQEYGVYRVFEATGRLDTAAQMEAASARPKGATKKLESVDITTSTDDSPYVLQLLKDTLAIADGVVLVIGDQAAGKSVFISQIAYELGFPIQVMGEGVARAAPADDHGLVATLTPRTPGAAGLCGDGVGKYLTKADKGEAADVGGGSTQNAKKYSTLSRSAEACGFTYVLTDNPSLGDPVKLEAYAKKMAGHPLTVLLLSGGDMATSTIAFKGWTRLVPSRPHFTGKIRIAPEAIPLGIAAGVLRDESARPVAGAGHRSGAGEDDLYGRADPDAAAAPPVDDDDRVGGYGADVAADAQPSDDDEDGRDEDAARSIDPGEALRLARRSAAQYKR